MTLLGQFLKPTIVALLWSPHLRFLSAIQRAQALRMGSLCSCAEEKKTVTGKESHEHISGVQCALNIQLLWVAAQLNIHQKHEQDYKTHWLTEYYVIHIWINEARTRAGFGQSTRAGSLKPHYTSFSSSHLWHTPSQFSSLFKLQTCPISPPACRLRCFPALGLFFQPLYHPSICLLITPWYLYVNIFEGSDEVGA